MFERDDQYRIFGVTAVENLFLTEYMPDANGDYVKVYLCGLFHSQNMADGYGLEEMAHELNLSRETILAALRYWERRRLVARLSENPPLYRFFHLGQRMLTGQDAPTADHAYVAFSEAVYALFGSRRKVRPAEIAMAYEWTQDVGLPQEAVLMLLNYCADTRGIGFSFKAAQTLAVAMREEDVVTSEDAENYLSRSKQVHDGARAVLRRFNLRRLPTEDELSLYHKWMEQWRFGAEDILSACTETVKASNPTFAYLNGILDGLRRRGAAAKNGVAAAIAQENDVLSQAREILQALGAKISPTAILPAYQTLRSQYEHALILLAARDVAARQGLFQDVGPRLEAWRSQGLDTADKASRHLQGLRRHDALLGKIALQSGQTGTVSQRDREQVDQWLSQGHTPEMIVAAAEQARGARNKMQYMQKVLDNWLAGGIRTPQDAAASPPKQPGRKVAAQQYQQRQYTEAELTQQSIDLFKEARRQ